MQIKSVILYNDSDETRQLNFELGRVNLITGDSDTGKSALIPIIDYCLGNSEFEVPEGIIKEKVSWYAVLYQVGNMQTFIAKPKPKHGNREHNAVFIVNERINIPDKKDLGINSNDDDIRDRLSELLRQSLTLPTLNYAKAKKLKVTIEYARFYLFQKIKVLVNDEILFDKQQQDYKTIKETLPYFLGAVNENELESQENCAEISRTLNKNKEWLKKHKSNRERYQNRTTNFFVQAQRLGLIERGLLTKNISVDEMVAMLKNVCNWQSPESASVPVDDFEPQLRERLEQFEKERNEKRHELSLVESYINAVNGYTREAHEHQMMLQSINLFKDDLLSTNCPLCGSTLKQYIPSISSMQGALGHLSDNLKFTNRDELELNSHIKKLKQEISSMEKTIAEIRIELTKIAQAQKVRRDFFKRLEIEHGAIREFIGGFKEFLEGNQEIAVESEEKERVNSLELQYKNCSSQLGELKDILSHKLSSLNKKISQFASEINLSYQGNYLLNLETLEITMTDERHTRPISMKSMGGGLNTFGCHLITLLALHKHFIDEKSPVPNFLIFDQPIQGYRSVNSGNYDAEKISKMIELILHVCQNTGLQVILIEREQLPQENLYQVELHWTAERALIPDSWKNVSLS